MLKDNRTHNLEGIEFKVLYSRRRTLGISVLPDSSVIVRVPYLTSFKTITRIVNEKADWIIKHRDRYKGSNNNNLKRLYTDGETHLFRGRESVLKISKAARSCIRFYDGIIEMELEKNNDPIAIKRLLYKGLKDEAEKILPEMLSKAIKDHDAQMFDPSGLTIRTMKRRWGSCSNKGNITLSTELIKLPDEYIEYVIVHELCHLKHHNHGAHYYKLLSELYPEWKTVRKEMRRYIQ